MQTKKSRTEMLFERIKIALRVRAALLIDSMVMFFFPAKKGENVLFVRTDAIGDYLLFREAFRKMRFSKKFANKNVIFCGNIIWKELFEKFDADLAQECIWIDRQKMLKNVFYRFSIQKKIRQLKIEYAVEPTFSRVYLLNDAVMKVCAAENKIADKGNTDNCIQKEKLKADRIYTDLLNTGNEILFERERNFRFAEKLTGEIFDRNIHFLPFQKREQENTIVFFYRSK
jgi:ADP-heptose:LPS heptosyltransferase